MSKRRSFGEKLFDCGNILFMVIFSITILLPFWNQICISLSTVDTSYIDRFLIWPLRPSARAYMISFQNVTVYTAYAVTVFRTVAGTLLTVVITAAAAYAWSKKYLRFRAFLNWFLIVPMFFSGGLIPTFLLIKGLGLYNNILVYILPALFATMNAVYVRNYMMTLPPDIEESARVDGANDLIIFFRLIFPLCKPILATIALWTMVAHWNSWFDSMIYTTRSELQTIGYYLQKIIIANRPLSGFGSELNNLKMDQKRRITPQSIQSAILIISILPILFSYPFLQKYFVKGIIVGSIKG